LRVLESWLKALLFEFPDSAAPAVLWQQASKKAPTFLLMLRWGGEREREETALRSVQQGWYPG